MRPEVRWLSLGAGLTAAALALGVVVVGAVERAFGPRTVTKTLVVPVGSSETQTTSATIGAADASVAAPAPPATPPLVSAPPVSVVVEGPVLVSTPEPPVSTPTSTPTSTSTSTSTSTPTPTSTSTPTSTPIVSTSNGSTNATPAPAPSASAAPTPAQQAEQYMEGFREADQKLRSSGAYDFFGNPDASAF